MRAGYNYEDQVGCIVLEGGETGQEVVDAAEKYEAVTEDGLICIRPPGMGMLPELKSRADILRILPRD
ncbi:MAG: hypothetical protein CMI58_06145 [Parcubacteria group bacterium]|jgi:hypothetical protein|nr:hypothetical protein [Parcubacteria group bacterium]|tara:strand:- start:587 stop:790 length:204 start_codon:yes stop_codon:yes gene_type:complete